MYTINVYDSTWNWLAQCGVDYSYRLPQAKKAPNAVL